MTSQVDIVNQALAIIGAQATVSSINPSDGSAEANLASILYLSTLEGLLRSAAWNFARKQSLMTQIRAAVINGVVSTDPPIQPWQYEYAYPTDCIQARYLLPYQTLSAGVSPPFTTFDNFSQSQLIGGPAAKFIVGSSTDTSGNQIRSIFTNLYQAQLIYTTRITNPDLWDAGFNNAMVSALGAWMCNGLNRNRELMLDCMAQAKQVILEARRVDGDEGLTSQDHLPDWMAVRGAGAMNFNYTYTPWSAMLFPGGVYY